MAELLRLEVRGTADLARNLLRLGTKMPRVLGGSLYRFGESVMAESKREVPVASGTLRGSGHVERPVMSPGGAEVQLGYGGPAEAYATAVHEDLTMHHKAPTKAKYLEDPLKRQSGDLLPQAALDAARALAGGGSG